MAKSLVIIEDDFIIQMFLENVVRQVGCEIVGVASDAATGIKMVSQKRPDVVLLDIGLKGEIDGIETSKYINENFNIPVVFVTGNSDKSTLLQAKKTNPIHIIRKPIDEEMLTIELLKICDSLQGDVSPSLQ